MKLSSKTRYGVLAVFAMAFHYPDRSAQIRELAEREAIPARFLEQIFQDLRRAGIVRSRRGPKGGYQLAQPPEAITLGALVRALDGPTRLWSESDASNKAAGHAVAQEAFAELARTFDAALDRISLGDLCERGRALGFTPGHGGSYVYVI